MLTSLGTVTLKSGERVSAAVVRAPDAEWAPKLERFLAHKGGIWNWQNSELLRHDVGVEARFHVLHRGGIPFAHILTAELDGVGLFGHVYTDPADRGQGASSSLQTLLIDDFRRRGGRALYLHTDHGSQAYRLYQRAGFVDLEPGSGDMRLLNMDAAAFDRLGADAAEAGEATIAPLGWRHWPTSSVLFAGDQPGIVRAAALGLVGRSLTEGHFLPLIQAERARAADEAPGAVALQSPGGVFLGFASRQPHPHWPGIDVLDCYCHPAWWRRAGDLIAALRIDPKRRLIAHADARCPQQARAFEQAGLQRVATVPGLAGSATGSGDRADVAMFVRAAT
ncbi:MAG TPA: GNAT family N-acetyltransferase [Planctomycetota bacterium]|nr:GNAT family N-acetyltransferase [Planctomycetota bacterium]